MEILDSNILLFRKTATSSIMKIIDNHISTLQVNDSYAQSHLSDIEKEKLTKFFNEKTDPEMLDYFLNFKADSRPDLNSSMWKHYIDAEWFDKTCEFRNRLRENFITKIGYAVAKMFHRSNIGYEGANNVNILGDLNKFAYHIGATEDASHDSVIVFPLQRVSVKLNRGDVLISPGSISHPYVITNVINGKFKFLEAI